MKREEKYFKMPYRRFDKPGRGLPDAPRYAGINASGRSTLSVNRLKSFLFLFLIVFAMLFVSYIPAEAYYLDAINPSGSKWVTSNPYSFTWNNNVGYWTPAWWGGSNPSYYYTLITIYNSGYKNNDSVVYGSSYSRTLNETPMNQSYWRARGYYSYRYDYMTYYVVWYPIWGYSVWCSWWSKFYICFWTWTIIGYYPVYYYYWTYTYYYNYSGYTDWKYFGVDLNKPAVTLTSPADGKAFCSNTSVTFMFSANDYYSGLNTSSTVSYMEIRKGSTGGALEGKYPITSGNNTINHNFTSPGTYYWHVVAKDNTNASNSIPSPHAATDSGWRSLTIDNVPPYTPTLSSPVGNVWKTTSTITFSWSAVTDQPPGTGIDAYYLKIKKPDGSDWPGYGEPYGKKLPNNLTSHSASGFAETPPSGSYTWYVYAEDTCGNKSVSAAGKFRVDLTDPSISITSPKSNGFPDNYIYNEYTASSVEFKATYSDNISGVKDANLSVYRPGPVVMPAPFGWTAAYAEYTTPRTISEFNDCKTGTYNGLWRADGFVRDHAGRTVSLSKNFQVDVTRPVISPGTGSNGNITKVASVDMTARPINDPDPPVIKTATPTIQWTSATEGAGQSGIANYFVKVWDSAGNLVVNPSGGVGIDAGATQSYTIPTPLATGLYYFEVSVTDKAKNGAVQNVDGISENNQTFYTSNDLIYTNKRRFRIDLEPPYVKGFTPPTPKSGNGMVDWVVSTNPSYTGEMKDTYGLSEYKIRLYSKNGASYTYITERQVTTGLPTGNTLYTIPNLTITTLNDGYYGFEIEAWDRATSPEPRQSAIAPATAPTLRYDFKVDTMPPISPATPTAAPTQPINDAWITVASGHSNPKRPTFKFIGANDNQATATDDASYSGVKEYMIRIWYDSVAFKPYLPPATSYTDPPFLGQPYKDYYIGTATTWTIPDDLKNGRYYWDVWVKDNANNWRWYISTDKGNYTTTSGYLNSALPTASAYKFRVDTTEPNTNQLVSYIGDVWIPVFKPNFVWKAADDPTPGSGRSHYEMWLWEYGFSEPLVAVSLTSAVAAGTNITLNYATGTIVKGAWPVELNNGRHYWDVKIVDIAGNYKWYKSGRVNQDTVANLGESFRVDKIPPEVGGFTDPTQNEWIDQRGTRFLDEATGDFIYKPNRKPAFKFKAARDNESLLAKYIVSLRVLNNSDTATLVADQALTPATNNDLFSLPFGTEYTFNPPWGTGTWPVELKDGRYRWEIKAIDNTYVNTAFYRGVAAPAQLYETFRLDTLPPTVAPNTVEPVRVSPTPNTTLDVATGIGVGQLLNPKYGDVTTVSVNLVYFNFSKAVDDINPSPCGQKVAAAKGGASGIKGYCFVMADGSRNKLKEFDTVDIWSSDANPGDYSLTTSAVSILLRPTVAPEIDEVLNSLASGSVYWSVHVMDNAGNESQYVDRKLRIRHLPPGGGHLEAPPHGFTTTNRRPKFRWTK